MEQHQQDIEKAGLRSVVVAQGEPKHAERYCGKMAPSSNCLVRDDVTAFKTYGLQRGSLGELINVGVIKAGMRAAAGGHIQGEAVGDTKMLPGTFIVDQDGIIRFAHYSKHAGEHPTFEDIFAAAKQI